MPAAICHTLETLPDDPHLTAVGLLRTETHPTEGTIRTIRPSVLTEGVPAEPGPPARAQGEDTAAVLAEAGLGPEEIAGLAVNRV